MNILKKLSLFVICSFAILTTTVQAQFDAGADVVSRYLWRGQLLASTPAFQPYVSYSTEKENLSFEIGAWGSYAFTAGDGTEADLYFSLGYDNFSIGITDYFFPSDEQFAVNNDYFDYDTHVIELNAGYSFGATSLSFNYNISGDSGEEGDLNSIYTELSYEATENLSLTLAAGDGWYTDDTDFGIVMVGAKVSKELQISETFSLPVFGTVGINPSIEKIYIVFGISF